MTLPGRGARALGRAGSLVAGADDGSAIYYNPAGLADIDGHSIHLDAGLVLQRFQYERVDSGNNRHPNLAGSLDVLPLPTVVTTWKPRKIPKLTLAWGLWVPYLGLNSWPEDGPQRYSVITLSGSLVAVLEFAFAYRLHEHVYFGAGLQNMILRFKSRVQLSACTGLSCAPEDPSFDSLTELDATSGFTPSGVLGATLVYPRIRAALVLQLPFFVRADGSVRSRLPSDPMFAGSSIVGESISVHFEIPLMLRFAVEGRPSPRVRLEAGLDYEAWSMQQRFAIHPHGIYIDNVPGIGRYYLSSMYLPRLMQDTVSVHAGGEFEVWKRHLVVRAGYLFETSATPDRGMSVLTADGLRNMICLGVGIQGGPVRIDVGYAHLFTPDRTVTNSESTQLNPIQPPQGVPVGNGTYKIDTDIVAVGLDARF